MLMGVQSYGQTLIDSLSSAAFTMDDSLGNKLAELALENPNIKMVEQQLQAAKYNVKFTKGSWLNAFTAAFNVNEISLKQDNSAPLTQNTLYPRYNFSLAVPLGIFFTKTAEVNKAKANQLEQAAKLDMEKERIKQEVKLAYQEYLLTKYLLAIEEEALQDEQIVYRQAEQRFKDNVIKLEAFTDATRKYNAIVGKRLTLMRDYNAARFVMEKLLGMDMNAAMVRVKQKRMAR